MCDDRGSSSCTLTATDPQSPQFSRCSRVEAPLLISTLSAEHFATFSRTPAGRVQVQPPRESRLGWRGAGVREEAKVYLPLPIEHFPCSWPAADAGARWDNINDPAGWACWGGSCWCTRCIAFSVNWEQGKHLHQHAPAGLKIYLVQPSDLHSQECHPAVKGRENVSNSSAFRLSGLLFSESVRTIFWNNAFMMLQLFLPLCFFVLLCCDIRNKSSARARGAMTHISVLHLAQICAMGLDVQSLSDSCWRKSLNNNSL